MQTRPRTQDYSSEAGAAAWRRTRGTAWRTRKERGAKPTGERGANPSEYMKASAEHKKPQTSHNEAKKSNAESSESWGKRGPGCVEMHSKKRRRYGKHRGRITKKQRRE